MQKQRMILKLVVLSVVTVVFPLLAQAPKPTCNHCSATYIPKSELDAYTKRAVENKLVDQQVRSVDIGKVQVGIGMVTRGKLDPDTTSAEAVAEYPENRPGTKWPRLQRRVNQEPGNPRTQGWRHDRHSGRDRALVY